MDIEYESPELFETCQILEPFLDRLVLVGGWAFKAWIPERRDDRYTKDTDFAIQLIVNNEYDTIRNHLFKNGFTENKPVGRFSFIRAEKIGERIIEIIPFGLGADQIVDFTFTEYQLAFEDNISIKVIHGSNTIDKLKCLNLSSLIVHKIFSYSDRIYERSKDYGDLIHTIKHYGEKGTERYGLTSVRKSGVINLEEGVLFKNAGVHLIGALILNKLDHQLFLEAGERLLRIIAHRKEIENDSEDLQRLIILSDYFQGKYEQPF